VLGLGHWLKKTQGRKEEKKTCLLRKHFSEAKKTFAVKIIYIQQTEKGEREGETDTGMIGLGQMESIFASFQ